MGPVGIEPLPAAEGDGERLGREIVCRRSAEASREMAVQGRELRVEGGLERPMRTSFPQRTPRFQLQRSAIR